MAYRKLHDLKKNPIIVGSIPAHNVVSFNIEQNNDQVTVSNGINQARLNQIHDVTCTVTLVLTQDSNTHILLKALNKSGVSFPISSVDKTTSTLAPASVVADGCRLQKMPPYAREAEQQDVEYVFVGTSVEITHSGAGEV